MLEFDVSVIMPAYRQADYIGAAIDSVLMQDYEGRVQLIVGDDCSPDQTEQVVAGRVVKNSNVSVEYYRHPSNIGLMRNYAFLLSKVKGRYLAILEADDFWTYEHKLAEQVAYLDANPRIGVLHTAAGNLYENGRIILDVHKARGPEVHNGEVFFKLLNQNFIKPLTVMVRTELLHSFLDMEEYIRLGFKTFDLPAWLELSNHCLFQFIDRPTAMYRILSTSISNSADFERKFEFAVDMERISVYFMQKYNVPVEYRRRVLQRFRQKRLKLLLSRSRFRMARSLIADSRDYSFPVSLRLASYLPPLAWLYSAIRKMRLRWKYE